MNYLFEISVIIIAVVLGLSIITTHLYRLYHFKRTVKALERDKKRLSSEVSRWMKIFTQCADFYIQKCQEVERLKKQPGKPEGGIVFNGSSSTQAVKADPEGNLLEIINWFASNPNNLLEIYDITNNRIINKAFGSKLDRSGKSEDQIIKLVQDIFIALYTQKGITDIQIVTKKKNGSSFRRVCNHALNFNIPEAFSLKKPLFSTQN